MLAFQAHPKQADAYQFSPVVAASYLTRLRHSSPEFVLHQ